MLPLAAVPLLAAASLAVSLVALRADNGAVPQSLPSFLQSALGPPAHTVPAPRRLARGVSARIGSRDFGIRTRAGRVTLTPAAVPARWRRFHDGVTRPTSFGHDTVVVEPGKVEELLTVTRRQGVRTWRWRIGDAGLTPRLGADGAVGFVARHRLAATSIAPVEILDSHGRQATPKGLRWSLRRSRGAWWLELRLDDRDLPLPYVVDPAITFRSSVTATSNGAASITISPPAGVAANDVMLAQIAVRSTPTITPPGGWVSVVRTTNGSIEQEIFRKKATASEPVSYTFNLSGSAKIVAGISAYVGVDSSTANGIDASGGNSGSSTSVTAPSVVTSRAGDMVAAYWAINTNTTLPADGSTTQRWTLQSGGGGAKHTGTAGDYTFAGTGGTGTKVSTAGASGAWVADQVALFLDNTPPSAPPPTITEGSNDSYQSGSTFYYRPAGGGGTFTVTEGASDPESGVKQVAFPGLAGGFTPTTAANVTASPYSRVYTWPGANGGSDSGSKTVTVTDNASSTATSSFTITPDSSVPTPMTAFPGTGSYNATGWAAGCAS
ncbi:MAG: hypothetical protein E6G42_03385, partial [Actinobacteria bacterium]